MRVLTAVAAAMALLMAGCGGDDEEPAPAAATGSATTETAAAAEVPTEVKDGLGTTFKTSDTIEKTVCVNTACLDTLDSLGTKPTLTFDGYGDSADELGLFDGTGKDIPTFKEFGDLEELAAADPDLIIGRVGSSLPDFAKVAPYFALDTELGADAFRDTAVALGHVLGKSEEAVKLGEQWDAWKQQMKEKAPPEAKDVTFTHLMAYEPKAFIVYWANSPICALQAELGYGTCPIEQPSGVKADGFGSSEIAGEAVLKADTDWVTFDFPPEGEYERKDATYKRLRAVREDNVYAAPGGQTEKLGGIGFSVRGSAWLFEDMVAKAFPEAGVNPPADYQEWLAQSVFAE